MASINMNTNGILEGVSDDVVYLMLATSFLIGFVTVYLFSSRRQQQQQPSDSARRPSTPTPTPTSTSSENSTQQTTNTAERNISRDSPPIESDATTTATQTSATANTTTTTTTTATTTTTTKSSNATTSSTATTNGGSQENSVRITLKSVEGNTRVVTVDKDKSVGQLKEELFPEVNTNTSQVKLIHGGRILADSSTLSQYSHIVDGSAVHYVISTLYQRQATTDAATSGSGSSSGNAQRSRGGSREDDDGGELVPEWVLHLLLGGGLVSLWALALNFEEWFSKPGLMMLTLLSGGFACFMGVNYNLFPSQNRPNENS